MASSLSFILSFIPLFCQVSAFARCDPSIINNIENSGLIPIPPPRFELFENAVFKYDYVSATDANCIPSADIRFYSTKDNQVIDSTFSRYFDNSDCPTSVEITYYETGELYEVDFTGFIDSSCSRNQVYLWVVQDLLVTYICSLESTITGCPLFTINTPIDTCIVPADQVKAAEAIITKVNGGVPVPLAKLPYPPTSDCAYLTTTVHNN